MLIVQIKNKTKFALLFEEYCTLDNRLIMKYLMNSSNLITLCHLLFFGC